MALPEPVFPGFGSLGAVGLLASVGKLVSGHPFGESLVKLAL